MRLFREGLVVVFMLFIRSCIVHINYSFSDRYDLCSNLFLLFICLIYVLYLPVYRHNILLLIYNYPSQKDLVSNQNVDDQLCI